MSNSTSLAQARTTAIASTVEASFFDLQGFELMQRIAKAFVSTDLVPKAYRGNLASCMIALNMAKRMNADPIFIMQNLYDVHGQPSWSSKFLIATVNACGRYASLKYEWRNEDKPESDDYGCRAWTTEKSTGERLNGVWVTWKMVRAEGWNTKNGSKWKTMPDQMFMYRAASFWARTNAPELSMGLPTVEEAHDIIDATPGADGTIQVDVESLRTQPQDKPQRSAKQEPPADATDVELKQSVNVDQDTGEVLDADSPATDYLDADKVLASIQRAQDHDTLSIAADSIQDCDPAQHDALGAAYRQRLDELDDPRQARATDTPTKPTRTRRAAAADME
jgi:hypothetical protein